jgi:hypothetical protein
MASAKVGSVMAAKGILGGKKMFASATSFPTTGDFDAGDLVQKTDPAASATDGWAVTQGGSRGTFASRTGTITQSSFALTVNSSLGVNVGTYLALAGMTGVPKVTSVNRTTLVATLDLAADATVTAGALTYRAASWVSHANNAAA